MRLPHWRLPGKNIISPVHDRQASVGVELKDAANLRANADEQIEILNYSNKVLQPPEVVFFFFFNSSKEEGGWFSSG